MITQRSLKPRRPETFAWDGLPMILPQSFFSLRIFGSVPAHDLYLEEDERAKFARTRKAIELHEQELLQQALIEERQLSA